MRDLLKSLAACKDVADLRSAIYEISAEFGEIANMDIFTVKQPGKRQALCFLRLESAAQERQWVANPGVMRFGGELLCIVDLPCDPASIAEQDCDHRGDAIQHPAHGQSEKARDKRLWFEPTRWSGMFLAAARRVGDREIGWPHKRLVR